MVRDVAQRGRRGTRSIMAWAVAAGTDIRLEAVSVYNVNRAVEQTGYVFFQSDIVKERNVGGRIKFNHDVDVTVGPVITARVRTE